MTKATMPAFVLALFDGEGGSTGTDTSTQNSGQQNGGTQDGGTANGQQQQQTDRHRDDQGRYQSVEQAQQRIRELNDENKTRRQENASLRKNVDAIARKTIRSEAKVALVEAGALHPDVVEIFLKTAGEKVKLNDDFEVTGIPDAVTAFKQSHAAFFKASESGGDDAAGKDGKKDDSQQQGDGKKNATAAGGSTQGGGDGGSSDKNGGLPDLRKLTPEERKKALDKYERDTRRR